MEWMQNAPKLAGANRSLAGLRQQMDLPRLAATSNTERDAIDPTAIRAAHEVSA